MPLRRRIIARFSLASTSRQRSAAQRNPPRSGTTGAHWHTRALPAIPIAGPPSSRASAETGYYGMPVLKKSAWTREIPIYFFVGGAAGAAAVIAAAGNLTGADEVGP